MKKSKKLLVSLLVGASLLSITGCSGLNVSVNGKDIIKDGTKASEEKTETKGNKKKTEKEETTAEEKKNKDDVKSKIDGFNPVEDNEETEEETKTDKEDAKEDGGALHTKDGAYVEVDAAKLIKDGLAKVNKYNFILDAGIEAKQEGMTAGSDVFALIDNKNKKCVAVVTVDIDGGGSEKYSEGLIVQYYNKGNKKITEMAKIDSDNPEDYMIEEGENKEDIADAESTIGKALNNLDYVLELEYDNEAFLTNGEFEISGKNEEKGIEGYVNIDKETGRVCYIEYLNNKEGTREDYFLIYEDDKKFVADWDDYKEMLIDKLELHNKLIDTTPTLGKVYGDVNKDATAKKSDTSNIEEDVTKETVETDEKKVTTSEKSENAIQAEEEIESYLGKKLKDFKYEHISYDFAEAGMTFKPREKVKIKLTYTNYASGEPEKLFKTVTLENKSDTEEAAITDMTVIAID